jgi:hypothetical protein
MEAAVGNVVGTESTEAAIGSIDARSARTGEGAAVGAGAVRPVSPGCVLLGARTMPAVDVAGGRTLVIRMGDSVARLVGRAIGGRWDGQASATVFSCGACGLLVGCGGCLRLAGACLPRAYFFSALPACVRRAGADARTARRVLRFWLLDEDFHRRNRSHAPNTTITAKT